MFYSHQILQSSQYGVSTIWIAANFSKTGPKKLSKRAIQDVNVPKACETILEPGPPLALRLQGKLLYGVSKVYSQQCAYVLSDAERTQSEMKTFFRNLQHSETNQLTGKANRSAITLEDDPSFDPLSLLPPLDLNKDILDFGIPSQGDLFSNSQMTPLDALTRLQRSAHRQASLISIDLPPSSHSGTSYRLPRDLLRHSSPFAQQTNVSDLGVEPMSIFEDDFDKITGIGLDFDGEGNLIEILDEPTLPPLRGSSVDKHPAAGQPGLDDPLVFDEPGLPDAEPFPTTAAKKRPSPDAFEPDTIEESTQISRPKRRRITRPGVLVDEATEVSRSTMRYWNDSYSQLMFDATSRQNHYPPSQCKKSAAAFVLNNGIAGIGQMTDRQETSHLLQEQFSGLALMARLRGDDPSSSDENDEPRTPQRRHTRQTSRQGFNTLQRAPESEVGRGVTESIQALALGDDWLPEQGMDVVPPMSDHHSSSLMPWSRAGSAGPAAPSSSIHGSAKRSSMVAPSPLLARSTTSFLAAVEQRSDPAEPTLALGDVSMDSSIGDIFPLNFDKGLDVSSQDFLEYTVRRLVGNDGHEEDGHRWVPFTELAPVADDAKAVAAQAFLHVLGLASKNIVKVTQEGRDDGVAFGEIYIGLPTVDGRDE